MNSNPISALVLGFKNYANFKGRTTRAEFWFWVLSATVLSMIANVIDSFITPQSAEEPTLAIPYVAGTLSLVFWLPSMAIAVRRIRDAGKSPWLYLLNLVPVVGFGVTFYLFVTEIGAFMAQYGEDIWSQGVGAGIVAAFGALASIFMMVSMADPSNPDVAQLLADVGQALSGTIMAFFVALLLSVGAGIWLFVLYLTPSKGAKASVED